MAQGGAYVKKKLQQFTQHNYVYKPCYYQREKLILAGFSIQDRLTFH